MRRTKIRTFLALLLAVAALTSTAHAMDITLRPDLSARLTALKWVYPMPNDVFEDQPRLPFPQWGGYKCNVVYLTGSIVPGDFIKITKWFDRNAKHSLDFVLNSPAGIFVEALKIGSMLKVDPTASDPPD
ncbi:hypothetical protein [Parasedimentitalea marina]|nr:hypothetical protein [Parasedimentitalea marina]